MPIKKNQNGHDNHTLRIFLTTPHVNKIVEPVYDHPDFIRTSLAQLAAVIRKKDEIVLGVRDAKFDQKNFDVLLEEISNFCPDILGISAFTYEINAAGFLAQAVKNLYPGCVIIIGGSHVTALPVQTLQDFPDFDIAAIGEAEESLPEICNAIIDHMDFKDLKGIAYRNSDGKILNNPCNAKIENLDALPMPAWDLFPAAKEYFIQSSRGCPYNCNFCYNPNGHHVRRRSVQNIIEEFEWLIHNKQPERISFGDEAFAADHQWASELLSLMAEKNIADKTSWDIQTHVSFINDDILLKMKKAGVKKIEMGVESGNDEIMKKIGKGINKSMVLNAFRLVKKHGIKSGAFFILGHPGETKKTIRETIRFAGKVNPDEPIFALMVPYPGTKIFNYFQNGLHGYYKTHIQWDHFRRQISNELSMTGLSNTRLRLYLIAGSLWVYLANFRFIGLIRFLYRNRHSAMAFLFRK